VYVFRDPPAENLPLIDVPIFTQPDDAPESLLIQIDEQDLGAAARERVGTYCIETISTLRCSRKAAAWTHGRSCASRRRCGNTCGTGQHFSLGLANPRTLNSSSFAN